MKSLLHSLLTIAMVLLLSGHAQAIPLNEEEHAYLQSKGEIVFAVQPNHAPFEFVDGKQLSGMNIELVQWMAAEMGFKVRFETAPLGEALMRMRTGKADAMSSLFYTEARDAELDFSKTLKFTPVALFVRNNRNDIAGIDQRLPVK